MLNRKLWRDIRQRASQFISLLLMAFLAMFVYAGVGAEWRGLATHQQELFEQTNAADVFIYLGDDPAGFTTTQLDELRELNGVEAASRRVELDAIARLPGDPRLDLYFLEDDATSRPLVVSGAAFDADDDGSGIWLFTRTAEAQGIAVGDQVTLDFSGASVSRSYTVRGLILSPEQLFVANGTGLSTDFSRLGYAYLSVAGLPKLSELAGLPQSAEASALPFTTITLKTSSDVDLNVLRDQAEDCLDNALGVWLPGPDLPSTDVFANEVEQHRMIADIFPVVFVLVALLALVTTMSRMIAAQRTQIGTLRALGLGRRQITMHYLGYGFWLTLLGAALGTILGPLLLPPLFVPAMSSFYNLASWEPVFDVSFIYMAAALVVVSTLISWLACRAALAEKPAAALRPRAPKAVRLSALERWPFTARLLSRLGFVTSYNLRSIRRNKLRSAMAVVGVLGCTALFVCALGMNDTMDDVRYWSFDILVDYDAELSLAEDMTLADAEDLAAELDGQLIEERAVELRAGGAAPLSATVIVLDTDRQLLKLTDGRFNAIELPASGVALTEKSAAALGLAVGDSIEWRIYGQSGWQRSQISVLCRQPTSQGIILARSEQARLGMDFAPTTLLVPEQPDATPTAVSSITTTAELRSSWEDLNEAMMLMVAIMI
ncbi:MAG: ABC transporter permease, partial [Coriobacteriales bacterium]|nr:ABC transporter permease [Coriobacteriales bacterium]